MAAIRANRESIDDRSSVLGFTVRSEQPFEIGLATEPELLQPQHRSRRTPHNFFSSGLLRATPSQRGEAIYLVPPDVLARFVGQSKLYFGLAGFREGDLQRPAELRLPDEGSLYVSLSGLTERGLRRTARGRGMNGYGGDHPELRWGGDAAAAADSGNGNGAAQRNGNGAAHSNGHGNGKSAEPAMNAAPAYSDGYSDDLWEQEDAQSRAGNGNGAAAAADEAIVEAAPASGAPSTAAGLRRRAPARSLLISSDYRPSNLFDALRAQLEFFVDSARWYLGVDDTRVMPHSATCQIRRPDGSSEGALHGSGFFIAPRLVMTAAHVVDGQSELIVVPGKNGAGKGRANEPFGRFKVTRFSKHPSYAGSDFDMALIEVPAANAAPAGRFFDLVEELNQSRPEGVVVSGYAARWYADDLIEHFVNRTIDPNKQHLMGGYIRELPTDETFSYNIQTLGGTSGSPVYWIEDTGAGPQAHLVGVHVAAHDETTNLGCRITAGKLAWVRQIAAQWGHTLSFALGARPEQPHHVQTRRRQTSRALAPIRSDYRPSNLIDALRAQLDFFADSARWFLGVDDTRVMPHSAICQVRRSNGSEHGTAFFIAPRLLLTAAHVVAGQSQLTIIPGKNGRNGEPYGRFTVNRFATFDGYSGNGDFDRDMALIQVPAEHAAPAGRYFDLVEELMESRPEGAVVSGYAAYSPPDGLIDHLINETIDPDKQHMMGGYIRELPTDGTFTYNIQSLGGTSGSPVYWIEDTGAGAQAHMVGVHVAGHDEHSNRGCRITAAKLNWIRRIAGQWGQSLSFALGARAPGAESGAGMYHAPARRSSAHAQAIPLDPGVGGQSIGYDALQPGDIIVSTARHPVSYAIRAGTVSAVSHAMLYVGDGRVVEAVGDGVREVELATAIDDAILAVAYRDPRVDDAAAAQIVGYAREQVGKPYNYAGAGLAGYRLLHPLRARLIDAIRSATGTGSDDARSFFCSELVFAAFREAGLPLLASAPRHGTPDDLVQLRESGLDYVGHLVARDERLGIALALSAPYARAQANDGPSDYPVHLIPQPDKNACWAASMAMLLAHRRQQSRTPESIVNDIGASLASSYGWDVLEAVRDRYGFEVIRQLSNASLYHSPRQWASWLNQFGPLWVVIVGAPHAVVLAGIRGNLDDAAACEVKILNPWDVRVSFDSDPIDFNPPNHGYEAWLPFADFAADFGNMAEDDYGNWRVLHLPATAASAQSLSRRSRAQSMRLRLARPPAPVRAMSAEAGEPTAAEPAQPAAPSLQPIEPSRVAGTRMQRLIGEAGPSRFRLDQLEGMKSPSGQAETMPPSSSVAPAKAQSATGNGNGDGASNGNHVSNGSAAGKANGNGNGHANGNANGNGNGNGAASTAAPEAPSGDIQIALDDWPALEDAPTPLPLFLQFSADGGAVGEVQIDVGDPADLPYGVDVVARIEDFADPEPGIAALKVRVDYRFRGLPEASPDAFVVLCLRGDGQFERENGWADVEALESAA
jgi:V8-like Glu-specific endopeptidase